MSKTTGGNKEMCWRVAGKKHDGQVMYSMIYTKSEADFIYDAWSTSSIFSDVWYQKNEGGWHDFVQAS